MTRYENITKCPLKHKQLIEDSSYLGQIITKMTENMLKIT